MSALNQNPAGIRKHDPNKGGAEAFYDLPPGLKEPSPGKKAPFRTRALWFLRNELDGNFPIKESGDGRELLLVTEGITTVATSAGTGELDVDLVLLAQYHPGKPIPEFENYCDQETILVNIHNKKVFAFFDEMAEEGEPAVAYEISFPNVLFMFEEKWCYESIDLRDLKKQNTRIVPKNWPGPEEGWEFDDSKNVYRHLDARDGYKPNA